MADLAFGTSAYSRARGNLPELPLINMFVEQTPSQEKGIVLQSRPGLSLRYAIGTGPIRGLFQSDGVLGGAVAAVSGAALYKDSTLLGAVPGSGPVSFAADDNEVLVASGAGLIKTDGTTVSAVTFPDTADVSKVGFLAGYFLAIRKDTGQFYFSAVLDGTSWQALDYASAEKEPDPLVDMVIIGDLLALIGSQTVEWWQPTGDADAPFAPISGRVFIKGAMDTGCACRFDNTVAWIGANNIVYMATDTAQRVSDAGIEERVAGSSSYALWSFFFEGHEFLAVRLPTGTWLLDAQTRQWCEFQSYGAGNWRGQCAPQHGNLIGDDTNGSVWEFGSDHVDAGGVLERRFRAGLPMAGGSLFVANARLMVNVGETGVLTGDYADPVAEIRTSRDAGRTWSTWRSAALGAQGEYRTRLEWRRVGNFDDPGVLLEFRCTDPVPFRVSAVKLNEQGGGRSR